MGMDMGIFLEEGQVRESLAFGRAELLAGWGERA